MTKYYLSIDFKSGNFYETSKIALPGYEQHVNTKNDVSYRRYHLGGVYGKLLNIGIRDTKIGQQCAITMTNGESVFYIGMNIKDQKGNFDNNFMKPLLKMLPKLNKEAEYTLKPFAFVPDEAKKDKKGNPVIRRGLSIKDVDNVKVEAFYTQAYTDREEVYHEGDIPALVFEQQLDGTIKITGASQDEETKYLLSIMLKEIGKDGRLAWKAGDPSTGPSDKFVPLGKAVPVANGTQAPAPTVVYTQEQPKTEPVAVTSGAMQPNTSFEQPSNVTVVTEAEEDDDSEDLPF